MRMIRKGDQGAIVREVQGNLRLAGAQLKVDGVFGPQTDKAVRAFQAAHHLPVDGVVGPRTMAALHNRSGRPKAPGHDSFDPAEFGAWLARLPGAIYDAVMPDAPPAAPSRAAKPAPAPASKPRQQPTPGAKAIVSPSQNKQHHRIRFEGHKGRGYVLHDFMKYKGYAIRLLGGRSIAPFDPRNPIRNECAQFVQFFGVALTREWRRGPQVCFLNKGDIPVGTVIATLRDGIYHNDHSGRSHVGIYLGHDPFGTKGGGVWMLDQFNKNPIDKRFRPYDGDAGPRAPIRATGRRFDWVRDGEEYFVLMT